jgi:hypothetical protein
MPGVSLRPFCEPRELWVWPRTSNENIHESLGTLFPVRTGGHIGNPDQRSKQIERNDVFSYVAALDGAP